MRLSPFPPDADRPVRGVLIYAAHQVWEQLRSWTFWGSMLLLPAIFGASLLIPLLMLDFEAELAPLVVVAPDAAVRAAIPEHGLVEVHEHAPPDAGERAVLWLEGGDVRELAPRLVLTEGLRTDTHRRVAEGLIRELQVTAWLPADEQEALGWSNSEADDPLAARADLPGVGEVAGLGAAASAPVPTPDHARPDPTPGAADAPGDTGEVDPREELIAEVAAASDEFTGMFGALFLGGAGLFSLFVGSTAGVALQGARDEGFFAVLRVGTPAAVLYLGSLLERTALGLLTKLPFFLLMALPMLIFGAFLAFTTSASTLLAILPLIPLGVLSVASGYLTAAGVGTVLATVQSKAFTNLRSIFGLIFFLALFPQMSRLSTLDFAGLEPLALIPGVGALGMLAALRPEGAVAWAWVGAAVQALVALGAVRLGTWIYALEEPPWEDLRRALGGSR